MREPPPARRRGQLIRALPRGARTLRGRATPRAVPPPSPAGTGFRRSTRRPMASRAAGVQGVDASAEDRPKGDRQRGCPRSPIARPAIAPLQRTVLQEGADRLPHEQWVAAGPLMDAASATGIDRGPCDDRRQLGGLGLVRPSARGGRRRRWWPSREWPRGACRRQDDERMACRVASTMRSTIPTLDGSSQCRSSMTTTRGPVLPSSRSMYWAATSVSAVATSDGSLGVSATSASQPEKAASRAIAAMAPPIGGPRPTAPR